MDEYRKVMNRSLTIVGCQYWDFGERVRIREICRDRFYAEPLFIGRPNAGVDVCYNWTDPKQDPSTLVAFFNEEPEVYWAIEKEYRGLIAKAEDFRTSERVTLRELFDLMVNLWPGLAISMMLGKWDEGLNSTIRKACYDLRIEYDEIFYYLDEKFEEAAAARLPDDRRGDYAWLTIEEIEGVLPSANVINDRKRGFTFYRGGLSIEPTEEVLTREGIHNVEEIIESERVLKGKPACQGVVHGIVKVVREVSQMEKVQVGDILVASMTTPNLLPAMERAAAFVTDEGGITCHAAIIAREMNKPCVIGTKVATRLLNDGDRVEVDAVQGLVIKIT